MPCQQINKKKCKISANIQNTVARFGHTVMHLRIDFIC